MKFNSKTIFLIVLGALSAILVYYWITLRYSGPVNMSIVAEAPMARPEDFSKCIIVQKDKAALKLDGVETNLSFESMETELAQRLKGVNQLNIICTKDADFQQVSRVLNAVTATGMQEYTLKKM